MLRRSAARHASIFGGGSAAARGAAEDWFGKTKSADTWRGGFISLLLCLCGIGVINQFTRGNVMGRAEYEDQIVTPFQNRKVPPPETYGFVDAETEAAEAKPPVRRA